MERLTYKTDTGKWDARLDELPQSRCCYVYEYYQTAFTKFAEYEDTDLTPAQITALKAENARLRDELEIRREQAEEHRAESERMLKNIRVEV